VIRETVRRKNLIMALRMDFITWVEFIDLWISEGDIK